MEANPDGQVLLEETDEDATERLILNLPVGEKRALQRIARKTHLTITVLVRQALSDHFARVYPDFDYPGIRQVQTETKGD